MPQCYLFLGAATERFPGGLRELSESNETETAETCKGTSQWETSREAQARAGQLPAGLSAQASVALTLQETTPTFILCFHRSFYLHLPHGHVRWEGQGDGSTGSGICCDRGPPCRGPVVKRPDLECRGRLLSWDRYCMEPQSQACSGKESWC